MHSRFRSKIETLRARKGASECFNGLTEGECRELLEAVDCADLVVTGLECWTSTDDAYFNCHVPEFFCSDYLFDFEDWHWHALEQHLVAYAMTVLAREPENLPRFCVTVSNLQGKKKFALELNEFVQKNRSNSSFVPKKFETSVRTITIYC